MDRLVRQRYSTSMERRRIPVVIAVLTVGGAAAGLLAGVITSALVPNFQITFDVPDHSWSYIYKGAKLLTASSLVGAAIGCAFSASLAFADGFLRRCVLSVALTGVNVPLALLGLYAWWNHGLPEAPRLLHLALATVSLSLTPLILALAHPMLAEGRTLRQFFLLSLPAYALLEGLGFRIFWVHFVEPTTHGVVGWIQGAVYGVFHCLGLAAVRMADASTAQAPPARKWLQSGIWLGMGVSLLVLVVGISSYLNAQPKNLPFRSNDRAGLLTTDDVVRNWTPDPRFEKVSKTELPDRTTVLSYEYNDPGGKLIVYSRSEIAGHR